MYRCQLCGGLVPPRTPCHRLVAQARPCRYPTRPQVNRVVRLHNGKRRTTYTDDPGGRGSAVVREVRACPACAASQARAAPVPLSP
jgi:hypothetical protein